MSSFRFGMISSALLIAGHGVAVAQAVRAAPVQQKVVVSQALGAEAFVRPLSCLPSQICAVVSPAMGYAVKAARN